MHEVHRLGFTKIGNGKGTALLEPVTTNPKGNHIVYLPVFNGNVEYMKICSKQDLFVWFRLAFPNAVLPKEEIEVLEEKKNGDNN